MGNQRALSEAICLRRASMSRPTTTLRRKAAIPKNTTGTVIARVRCRRAVGEKPVRGLIAPLEERPARRTAQALDRERLLPADGRSVGRKR